MGEMVGAWERWYRNLDAPASYGDTTSYHIAADWLADCSTVSDWGCGKGWFRTVRPYGCVTIDGTMTPYVDIVADLRHFACRTDGVLLRHVLEHNYDWPDVLVNAIMSAKRKLCIILFTPPAEETYVVAVNEEIGIPDISFRLKDIVTMLEAYGAEVSHSNIKTATQYGEETIIKAEWS